jgi:hypothetical protein
VAVISFVAGGYIEVTRNGVVLSRHRLEREAIESCAKLGPGRYVLYYPSVRVEVEGTETGVINGAGLIDYA